LIIIPAKCGALAPTLQRGSKDGRSASRVLAETMIKAVDYDGDSDNDEGKLDSSANCARGPQSIACF